MIRNRSREWGIFTLLLIYCGLISAVQLLVSGGLVRWSGYSVLTPLVASALLPFWRTVIVGACTLLAIIGIYGFAISSVSVGGRVVVIAVVALAFGISLVVCRVRLERQERFKRLMIARARLALLSDASSRVGSTLAVTHTAQELADVAVPQFADFVSVDLLDSVVHGEVSAPGPITDPVVMCRVAHASVLDGCPEAALDLGATDTYPEFSPPARSLATGRPVLSQVAEDLNLERWLAQDPNRIARVRGHAFHSVITVPLCARETTLGVAVFARHQRREPFDDDDLLLAEEIAARAAVCIDNARRYTHERDTAVTLQHSLLPHRLPDQTAMDVAFRYLPADSQAGVGGDWFDVIPLSSARVALVVGDVVGHGIQASATMGRLRAAVRTLADIDLPPDELLTHLDDLVIRLSDQTDDETDRDGDGSDVGATCLYAIYDPISRHCTLARAGHPPPAIVNPDGTVSFVDLPADPPLGLGGLPFESTELELPEGSLLVLYTDGLIESRDRDVDKGLDDLSHVLTQPTVSLNDLCDNVLKTLLPYRPIDDVALLIARTRALDADHVATWQLPTDPAVVAHVREQAVRQLASWGLEHLSFTTELVISELVTNAIRYAHAPIQLRLIRDRILISEVSDGSSTSPHLRRARTYDEGGRGLFLVAQLSQRWGTRHTPTGKTIWTEQL